MTAILWTEAARNDLSAIHDYIARDSKIYARRMIGRIKKAVERLQAFPESGGRVPEWDREELREVLVGNYRIIYQFVDAVRILAILHGARVLPSQPPTT